MAEAMRRRLAIIVAVILLMFIPAFGTGGAAQSWVKPVYDPSLSSQTRENFQKAVDTIDELFTKYKIVLSDPVTLVVAANDAESYIRALMLYCNMSRAQAEHLVKIGSVGSSSTKKPVIVIRYRVTWKATKHGGYPIDNFKEEGLWTLSHEIFHQAQHQNYSRAHPVLWLLEGPPELFQYMAFETARIRRVTDFVRQQEESIRRAAKIPDTRQLASYDYKTWLLLAEQGYPIYPMAVVMTSRLIGDNGFGKVLLYYQLLHNGSDPDKAFITAFGRPMSDFLTEMNEYFNNLRR
jgi:hypothetical protein